MAPDLSICFSTYGQQFMLKRWFDAYLNEPQEYRDKCEVVCVDDGGTPSAEVPDSPEIRLYRVKQDLSWNQPGARNLAAHVAKANVLLMVDVDMTIPPGMLRKYVAEARQHKPTVVLHPHIVHSVSGQKGRSPNVHFLRKKDFMAVGGYDEDYVGHKGWSDVTLLHVMNALLKTRPSEHLYVVLHHDSDIPDAQVRTLNRDVKHNKKLHEKHIAMFRKSGYHQYAKSIKRLRFEWNQVK